MRRSRIRSVVLALAVALAIAFANLAGLFEFLELRAIDAVFFLRGPIPRTDDILIVAIDDESFEQTQFQWPWPRGYLAEIIRAISAGDPSVIIVDVFFYEPGTDPGGDAELAAALAAAGNVVLANDVLRVRRQGIDLEQYRTPVPALHDAAYMLGLANFAFDRDGIVRRALFYLTRQGDSTPYFHWATIGAATYLGAPLPEQYVADGAQLGPHGVPLEGGTLYINFRGGPGYFDRIPAYQVANPADLASYGGPALFTDKVVLIGATTESLHDTYPTPFSRSEPTPGVEVMANAISTLIEGDFIVRWQVRTAALLALALSLVAFLLSRLPSLLLGLGVVVLLVVAYTVLWGVAFINFNSLIPLASPLIGLTVGFAVPSVERAVAEELERRRIRHAFSHYLSPTLVDQLARDPEKLKLGGERRNMTFLFSDIRGFTPLSERLDAQALTRLINRFLTPMTDLIMEKHHGTIDKYMGDCIMAFWNAPVDDPLHARNACRAALDMRVELVDLNNALRDEAEAEGQPHQPIHIGIGVNTGDCSVGNFGSDQRFDYSVIGDNVNLASRLEGQSKNYGVDIVIGENTRAQAPELATLELDLITVKGKTVPVHIYALLGDETLKERRKFKHLEGVHQAMLVAYRRQEWVTARRLLERCRELDSLGLDLDTLYDMYLERIEAYEANPPAEDWDGVFLAETK